MSAIRFAFTDSYLRWSLCHSSGGPLKAEEIITESVRARVSLAFVLLGELRFILSRCREPKCFQGDKFKSMGEAQHDKRGLIPEDEPTGCPPIARDRNISVWARTVPCRSAHPGEAHMPGNPKSADSTRRIADGSHTRPAASQDALPS